MDIIDYVNIEGGERMEKNVSDSYEAIMERIRMKVYNELSGEGENEEYKNYNIINTFDDAVILKEEVSGRLYEVPYIRNDNEIYLGKIKEVQNVYVAKRLEEAGIDVSSKGLDLCELTGPIVMKNATKKIAYAAVLVPGEADHDGEVVTKEKIEEAAHEWMQSYRNVDLQHTLNNVAIPVESYILPYDMEVNMQGVKTILPEGTWILASKVLDDSTWNRVEKGELTGYSVMGIKRTTLESASKSKDVALKKTLLRDLGPDWVAAAVSIVDEPAVPKAKFFALKSKDKDIEEDKSWYQKVKELLTHSDKKSEEKGEKEKEIDEEITKDGYNEEEGGFEMKAEELKELIDEAVKTAIQPIINDLEAVKSKVEGDKTEEAMKEEEKKDEIEVFKSEVIEKLEELEARLGKKSVSSKSLKGQDGEEEKAIKEKKADRDAFGRKRNIKEVE